MLRFDNDGYLIDAEEFVEISRGWAPRDGPDLLLEPLSGRVAEVRGLEVCRRDLAFGLRVSRVRGVLGGEAFAGEGLELRLAPGQAAVSLRLAEAWAEVVPGGSGVRRRAAQPELFDPLGGGPGLEIARLDWEAGVPSIDEARWPEPLRIGADPRSLAAAHELIGLAGPPTPELAYEAARVESIAWPGLLRPLLRLLSERWKAEPARLSALAAAASSPGDCRVVAALRGLLRVPEVPSLLPESIQGGRWRRVAAFEPTRETRVAVDARRFTSSSQLQPPAGSSPPKGRTWGLVVALKREASGGDRRVWATLGGETYEAHLALGGPRLVGRFERSAWGEVSIEVADATVAAAGAYAESPGVGG